MNTSPQCTKRRAVYSNSPPPPQKKNKQTNKIKRPSTKQRKVSKKITTATKILKTNCDGCGWNVLLSFSIQKGANNFGHFCWNLIFRRLSLHKGCRNKSLCVCFRRLSVFVQCINIKKTSTIMTVPTKSSLNMGWNIGNIFVRYCC